MRNTIKFVFRFLTVASATCVLASVGGFEQNMFGLAGLALRVAAFSALTFINLVIAESVI